MQQRPVMRWIGRCANPRHGRGNDRGINELRGDRCSQSLPGMSKGRTAHDRQRHDTGGARHPGMNAGARRDQSKRRRCIQKNVVSRRKFLSLR